ncbi:uncharacterized protein CIMG_12608 [Coccidioides immitis RS]|uniref:uncharacterized protein n=1 Tax=Coccidioides immitis (strain RS) TaxID=246410 RepID=UPI0000D869F3|nr:uncharacterized protein CIMG_12608 [Coccidioides immitis RS]EAS37561.3 hypothetical protein CIMG_12608 [Coccidioides immitis RS]
MSAFKIPAINAQDLINRILQLEQIIKKLGEQNCELKDYNEQLETQIMAIPFTGQEEKKDKAKVNLPELFKSKWGKLQALLRQLCIYMNMKDKELNSNKNKIMMTVSYLCKAAFDLFNTYLQNYYKKDEDNQNNNMLKIINNYNIFIWTFKITFREVKE